MSYDLLFMHNVYNTIQIDINWKFEELVVAITSLLYIYSYNCSL